MVAIDAARLVWEWLAADAGVTAEVGTNIYGPPGLPKNFTLQKAVVFVGDGGDWDLALPLGTAQFQFRMYGKTAAEARAVWRAVASALHSQYGNISVGGETWGIGYAMLTTGPYDMLEPDLGWPFVLATFQIRFVRVAMP